MGLQASGGLNDLRAVLAFTDDGDVVLIRQELCQACPDEGMVVDDQQPSGVDGH